MNQEHFQEAVAQLYALVRRLEEMFPGRPFTPDGHLVGSLGECLVAEAYGLNLMPPSNTGFDAMDPDGRRVEIKTTQGKSVAFRSEPEHCIAIKLEKTGKFEEIYNGPGHLIWREFGGKPVPKNGQYQISLKRLQGLQKYVESCDRIPRNA